MTFFSWQKVESYDVAREYSLTMITPQTTKKQVQTKEMVTRMHVVAAGVRRKSEPAPFGSMATATEHALAIEDNGRFLLR